MSTIEQIEAKYIQKGIELGIKQGMRQGIEQGMRQGIEIGTRKVILSLHKKGYKNNEIADFLDKPVEYVKEIITDFKKD